MVVHRCFEEENFMGCDRKAFIALVMLCGTVLYIKFSMVLLVFDALIFIVFVRMFRLLFVYDPFFFKVYIRNIKYKKIYLKG